MRCEDIENKIKSIEKFDRIIIDSLVGKDPLPSDEYDKIEVSSYEFLKKHLSVNKTRDELFSTTQWIEALKYYLPEKLKYLADNIKLYDFPITENDKYNKVLEEIYYNINTIFDLAIEFIRLKEIYKTVLDEIEVANTLQHLAIGLSSEVNRFNFYNSNRKQQLNLDLR